VLSDNHSRVAPRFFPSGLPTFRSAGESADSAPAPASYWLLLAFLVLLYANLPFVLPAADALRPAAVVGGLALLMIFAEVLMGRRVLTFAWPEGALLVAFVGAAALSCLTALWPRQAAESLSDLVKMGLVFFFIANCADTERRLRGVMWTIVICGLIPAAGTLRNYLDGHLAEGRASWLGIFANPNEVAYSLVILLPIAAFLAIRTGFAGRLLLLGTGGVFVAAIFVTFSRGGLIGLGAVVVLYAWRRRSLWLQIVLVLLVVAGLSFGEKYWSRDENFSSLNGDVSFRQRLATSEAGLRMFADHPLTGVGLGCSLIAWPLYAPHDLYSRSALVTHNTVIQPLGETGILGFVPFALLIGFGIWHARKIALNRSREGMSQLGAGLEIAVWGFVVCGLSGGYVLTWFPYILLGMVAAARQIPGEV